MENPGRNYKEELKIEIEKNKKAALMGLQLIEETKTLNDRIDAITKQHLKELTEADQARYSLNLKLEQKCEVEKSQAADLERAREHLDKQVEELHRLRDSEKNALRKMSQLKKEVEDLEEIGQEQKCTQQKSEERIQLLERQLAEARDLAENMMSNTYNEESQQQLQATIMSLTSENQMLQHRVNELTGEFNALKSKEERLQLLYQKALEEMEIKNDQVSSYHSLMQTAKEEQEELQAQIEMMKLRELDVGRRGNSLFAEVEDNRHLIQQNMNILQLQYKSLKEKYDSTFKENLYFKQQRMFALQNMAAETVELSYVRKLEQSLAQSRNEVSDLTCKLKEATSFQATPESQVLPSRTGSCSSQLDETYGYLKSMFDQMRKKKEIAEKELQEVRFLKMSESDKLLQCERKLYAAERAVQKTNAENTKLKVKMEEILGEINGTEGGKKKIITRVEKIPGFECPLPKKVLSVCTNNASESKDVVAGAENKENLLTEEQLKRSTAVARSKSVKKVTISEDVTSIDCGRVPEGTVSTGRRAIAPTATKMDMPPQCNQQ